MNTITKDMSIKELNLNELENVHGGIDWDKVCGFGWLGGSVGFAAAGLGLICAGPIGWGALGLLGAGAAAGAVVGGGVTAAVTADD